MGCGDRTVRMMENGSDIFGMVMGCKSWSRTGCRGDRGDVGEGWRALWYGRVADGLSGRAMTDGESN